MAVEGGSRTTQTPDRPRRLMEPTLRNAMLGLVELVVAAELIIPMPVVGTILLADGLKRMMFRPIIPLHGRRGQPPR